MLYVNKNEIFIAFLTHFSGPQLMEMKAHKSSNFQRINGIN